MKNRTKIAVGLLALTGMAGGYANSFYQLAQAGNYKPGAQAHRQHLNQAQYSLGFMTLSWIVGAVMVNSPGENEERKDEDKEYRTAFQLPQQENPFHLESEVIERRERGRDG